MGLLPGVIPLQVQKVQTFQLTESVKGDFMMDVLDLQVGYNILIYIGYLFNVYYMLDYIINCIINRYVYVYLWLTNSNS